MHCRSPAVPPCIVALYAVGLQLQEIERNNVFTLRNVTWPGCAGSGVCRTSASGKMEPPRPPLSIPLLLDPSHALHRRQFGGTVTS